MRSVPAALQARLDSGVTTLAQLWKLSRRDGGVLGFTDHDRDLVIDGVTYRAGTGFGASEASQRFDLSVDGGEVAGALDDDVLTEADLAAGRYDAAGIEAWLVDWSDVTLKLLVARGRLGEVRREGTAFTAELRGQADLLSQESGRLYTAKCGADLGDARCRVDLASAAYRGSGSVQAVEGTSLFTATGLDGFADRWFSAGRLSWVSGGNAGLSIEIKLHRNIDGEVRLTLWQAMPEPVAIGDAFTLTAGCDKLLATCRDRFANADNFRGFPHIPGNDFVLSYPNAGTVSDSGASLVLPKSVG
ncbi:DUF2163 domain-containing protein [Tardiphaga sp. vice352]|uniref:DUF2163 domain-containing protein n=1 Tax=unclassified Tardiphaga TaxID=2631404 RepID=UPI001164D86C|nr:MULTISPECIES: DUF2163 domain-containing protein [unclassified Tardiphaga]QDM16583.1 DUF2163 domain-containing protein [Tardiphaga sp. vice278]QDM21607.1 DUF2163 domain-containing protein [Tardiphaga sp. vice154]QDM26793.1 DUF2163 domain-containing protein [Tardiphaga sp. vice304]QDM31856.1 DUF2163 domain-containing protein [Tardiphaga sp. vice352]